MILLSTGSKKGFALVREYEHVPLDPGFGIGLMFFLADSSRSFIVFNSLTFLSHSEIERRGGRFGGIK